QANTYHDEEYIASGDKGIASGPSCFLHEFCHDTFTERSSEWAQGSRSVSMELSITMRPLYSMRKASPRVTLPISCATTLYCLAVWRTQASDEAFLGCEVDSGWFAGDDTGDRLGVFAGGKFAGECARCVTL